MIEITLDDSDFKRGLAQLLRNATDTAPMMSGIAAELLSLTEDNFAGEGWGGSKWQRSLRAASGGKTLQDSGQLAASISTQSGNGYARIGTNKVYAAVHHFGGQAGRGHHVKLPARPFLPLSGESQLQPGAEDKILQVAIDALSSGV